MSKKSTRALASATLMSLVLTTALSAGPVKAAAGEVTRVGEADRYSTAAKVATANWTTSENVVLVSGEGYADAVSASALAKKLNAPILLTTAGSLNTDAKNALNQLKPKNIYVVGGNASVSSSVRADLKANYSLVELGGQNRYETNVAVAKELVKLGVKADEVMLVGGEGFSDALSVAPIAAAKGQILLLGNNNADSMKSVIDFVKSNNSKVTVVGTKNVINDAIYSALGATNRVDGGQDRFDTNLKVLASFKDAVKMDKLYVANATGDGYADALVASALAGKFTAPLVLVGQNGEAATNNAVSYIKNNATKDTDLNVVGGTGVVSNDVVGQINNAVKGDTPAKITSITSVEAVKDQTVNCKVNDETLKFTVNGGKTATVDDVIDAGYEVKFIVDEKVFDGGDKESKDGKLDKTRLRNLYNTGDVDNNGAYDSSNSVDHFKYQVIIEKDGEVVAQSSKIEVNIINAETTATSIGDVTIKMGTKGETGGNTTLSSNKLVEGQKAYVDEVKGNSVDGKHDITITNTKFYSSDPFIATVDEEEGTITAVAKGDFKLKIKSGNTTKEISMSVVTEARKVNSATASLSSIKLAKGATTAVEFVLKDQYGDPIKDAEFQGTSVTSDQAFAIENIKDGDKVIATATALDGDKTTKKGKIKVNVTGTADTGKATLRAKINSGKTIVSIPVEVVAAGKVDTYKIEKAETDGDFNLDLNPEAADKDGNSQVKVKINAYDRNGVLLGTVGADGRVQNQPDADKAISIELSQPKDAHILAEENGKVKNAVNDEADKNKMKIDVANIDKDGTLTLQTRYEADDNGTANDSKEGIFILNDKADTLNIFETGNLTLTVKNSDNEVKTTKTITVKDSSPTITGVKAKSDLSVLSGEELKLEDIIKADDISVSKTAGEGHVIIANNGTIFMNYDTENEKDVNSSDEYSDITTDSAIKFMAGKDIYLGRIDFASENGKVDPITWTKSDGGKIKFELKAGETKDQYVMAAVKRAHEKGAYKTIRIRVESKN